MQSDAALTGQKTVIDPFLRLPQVLHVAGIGKTTFYYLVKCGRAPAPAKIGRTSLWRASTIASWLDQLDQQSKEEQS